MMDHSVWWKRNLWFWEESSRLQITKYSDFSFLSTKNICCSTFTVHLVRITSPGRFKQNSQCRFKRQKNFCSCKYYGISEAQIGIRLFLTLNQCSCYAELDFLVQCHIIRFFAKNKSESNTAQPFDRLWQKLLKFTYIM